MKSILSSLLSCFLLCNVIFAQVGPYEFSTFTDDFEFLEGAVDANGGNTWDDPDVSIPVGFEYQMLGETYNSILLSSLGLGGWLIPYSGSGTPASFPIIMAYASDLVDINWDFENFSGSQPGGGSPLSYKTEGTPGNQIFKLEYRNAGFYNELSSEDTIPDNIINLQFWIYEATGSFEVRFGDSNIIDPGVHDFNGPLIGLISNADISTYPDTTIDTLYFLQGAPENPTIDTETGYSGFNNLYYNNDVLTGDPISGTVYRFQLGEEPVSTFDLLDATIDVFPSLTNDFVNVRTDEQISVQVFDVQGKLLQTQLAEQQSILQIDLSNYDNGNYFIKVISENGYAVKQVIKQ